MSLLIAWSITTVWTAFLYFLGFALCKTAADTEDGIDDPLTPPTHDGPHDFVLPG